MAAPKRWVRIRSSALVSVRSINGSIAVHKIMDRIEEFDGDIERTVLRAIAKRKDRGLPFNGAGIDITTFDNRKYSLMADFRILGKGGLQVRLIPTYAVSTTDDTLDDYRLAPHETSQNFNRWLANLNVTIPECGCIPRKKRTKDVLKEDHDLGCPRQAYAEDLWKLFNEGRGKLRNEKFMKRPYNLEKSRITNKGK